MTFKLFNYQADLIRESGMCPRKIDTSQPLCPPDKCLECKKEAKKALLEEARKIWHGEPEIPKGETFERELQNEVPKDLDDGVPLELKKYESFFRFDPADLINHDPLPHNVDAAYEKLHVEMAERINRKIMGFD